MNSALRSISAVFAFSISLTGCDTDNSKVVALTSAQSGVAITELLPQDSVESPSWIELYNPSATAFDLNQCEFSNSGSSKLLIDQSVVIQPESDLAIVNGKLPLSDSIDKQFIAELNKQDFLFSSGPESLTLICAESVIDQISYQVFRPGPASPIRSLQLDEGIVSTEQNDLADSWCHAPLLTRDTDTQVSTPGSANPNCLKALLVHAFHDNQQAVLIDGIDFDTTMQIARNELKSKYATAELTIWAIRDQEIPQYIAAQVSQLYFEYIEGLYNSEAVAIIDWNHAVWHFSWAISNMYRNGDEQIKETLQQAYDDALKRPQTLKRFRLVAVDHIVGDRVTMGDMHERARQYAQSHIVVPDNLDYIQNYQQYLDSKRSDTAITLINLAYKVTSFF
jgi:hypothetical protein